jgi:hypothetical protein
MSALQAVGFLLLVMAVSAVAGYVVGLRHGRAVVSAGADSAPERGAQRF